MRYGCLGLLLLVLLSGCLTRQAGHEHAEISIFTALPVGRQCQDLGEILGVDGDGQNCAGFAGRPGNYDNALWNLKHKAARLGANALIIQESLPPSTVSSGCQRNQWELRAKVYVCQ